MIALALVVARMVWKLVTRSPAPLAGLSKLQIWVSKLTHAMLYALMLGMPLMGWVMSSAGGYPVKVFGLEIPAIVEKNPELGKLANQLHELGGYVLIGLILLHIGAAIYHQFIRKDGLLARMLPCPCEEKNGDL